MSILLGAGGGQKTVKEVYIGVNGQAKKVKEGYVGVGGVPKQFWSSFPPIGKKLEEYTWDEISAISRAGKAKEYGFQAGDSKGISFNSMSSNVVIIGFDHDFVVGDYGRDFAGITFQIRTNAETAPMNEEETNVGGWRSCTMRTTTLPQLKTKLPADLQNVICSVSKTTGVGSGDPTSGESTTDDLWLPSEIEVYGASPNSYFSEGEQYEFFKDEGNRTPGVVGWWLRSPFVSLSYTNQTSFCFINGLGECGSDGANMYYDTYFCFCV